MMATPTTCNRFAALWIGVTKTISNVKTKQIIADFRRCQKQFCGIEIKGETVQGLKSYKYPGIPFDDKLSHHTSTQSPTVLLGLRPSFRYPHHTCTQPNSPTALTQFGVLFHLCRTYFLVRFDRCHALVHIGSLRCSTRVLRIPHLNAGTTKQKRYVLCTRSVGSP